ncbi:MAG: T9SS type A sorting domain-containing protein [candidate division Zixibacteria bacterium]|nr:T9SS type A sorting domain-containing protein [candidate division Zixibacteria bacterium]
MKPHNILFLAVALVMLISLSDITVADDWAYVWYGNLDDSPVDACIGEIVYIDVYIQNPDNIVFTDFVMCLGIQDLYLEEFMGEDYITFHYPTYLWDSFGVRGTFGSPPNIEGWSSQLLTGFAELFPPYDSPFMDFDEPTLAFTFAPRAVNDPSIIGETADCIGVGYDPYFRITCFGSVEGDIFPSVQYYSPVYFAGSGGSISGMVTDSDGYPIQGVQVTDIETSLDDYTDSEGEYYIPDLNLGAHSLSFSHAVFFDTVVSDIDVFCGDTTSTDIQMRLNSFLGGTVTDSDSVPLYHVNVCMVNTLNLDTITTQTTIHGQFAANYIFAGLYDISFSKDGYNDTTLYDIYVPVDNTTTLDVIMTRRPDDYWINIWYGNMDSSPIEAVIGELIDIDVYIQTSGNTYIADIHLCLGSQNIYIETLLSEEYGEFYYPFTLWDSQYFYSEESSPPNPEGWSSQSMVAFYEILPPYNSPALHFEEPTCALKMVARTVIDSSLLGGTYNCLGQGIHPIFGPSNCGDTIGYEIPLTEYYCPINFVDMTDIDYADLTIPKTFEINQNYPNPFNAATSISYCLPKAAFVIIEICDILGQKVETLVNANQPAGYHEVIWDASKRSSSIYFYHIQAGDFSQTRKMTLLK